MNERIKELAAEAWQYADNNSRDGDGTHGWLYRDKFAELIVHECAELTLDFKNDQHYQGWIDYRDEIRRHFGIK